MMEIIYKDIQLPRLTIEGERITLKIPLGYEKDWVSPLIAFVTARIKRISDNPFRCRIKRKRNASFEFNIKLTRKDRGSLRKP